jgi:hypothetical protein
VADFVAPFSLLACPAKPVIPFVDVFGKSAAANVELAGKLNSIKVNAKNRKVNFLIAATPSFFWLNPNNATILIF